MAECSRVPGTARERPHFPQHAIFLRGLASGSTRGRNMQEPVYPIRTARKKGTAKKAARKRAAAAPARPAVRETAKKAVQRKKAEAGKDAWKIVKVGFHFG